MTPENIQNMITEQLGVTFVEVESADNVHFYVKVVSENFTDLSKIAQHKLVKELFVEQFADETIHAMSLKTFTPEKWAQKQAEL